LPGSSKAPANSQPSPLTGTRLLIRLAVIVVIVAGVAAAFAYTGGWFSPHRVTPARFIDTFEKVGGLHLGFRRNHAKGVCVTGFFESNGKGVRLSKAVVFEPGRVPVVGRFALAGGQPYVHDAPQIVRSMAILFRLPDGEQWRTGMNNIPVFVVSTPEALREQLIAFQADPVTGKPDPARMKAFLEQYPESARAIQMIQSHPVSSGFDNSTYNSLDAFRLIDAAGNSIPVRWSMVPMQPFVGAGGTQAASQDKNYLFDALVARVNQRSSQGSSQPPLQWHLMITLGQPGDPTKDAAVAWPDNRERVDVGTLTIDHIESETTGACRDINYDPLVLPSGIEPSDDPLLSARSATYSQSFTRRAGEPKEPSAVTPSEVSN
jgi:catalase